MRDTTSTELSGIEKASLLLVALGSSTASNVLQQLSPDEVRQLCEQIAKLKRVNRDLQEQVLQEYVQAQEARTVAGGVDYARELLEQTVGASKAEELILEIKDGLTGRPFDWLKGTSTQQIAASLQSERPQVTALVLAHLPAHLAADVISLLPEDVQGKVAYRLTAMQPVSPDTVKEVEQTLKGRLSREVTGDLKEVGGLRSLVNILNNADRPTEKQVLHTLEQIEASVAESVREMMFVFEDMVTLDDHALQIIIRELDQQDLRLCLKGATDDIKEAFLRNMSERAAEALKEDLEMMGPVKLRDVEAARSRVVAVVRKLDEEGQIALRVDAEDMVA